MYNVYCLTSPRCRAAVGLHQQLPLAPSAARCGRESSTAPAVGPSAAAVVAERNIIVATRAGWRSQRLHTAIKRRGTSVASLRNPFSRQDSWRRRIQRFFTQRAASGDLEKICFGPGVMVQATPAMLLAARLTSGQQPLLQPAPAITCPRAPRNRNEHP